MALKQQLISPELLIHPGVTLQEYLEEFNMTQVELAKRTSFTEKHVSTVINGSKKISAEFALKLEYALGVPAYFWQNLQRNYDLEEAMLEETHNITKEEINISKDIKKIYEDITNTKLSNNEKEQVLQLRRGLEIADLTKINELNHANYRYQFQENMSENAMYTWRFLCEKDVRNQKLEEFDIDILKSNLQRIKHLMHVYPEEVENELRKVLNKCGIGFIIKKHGDKAPINGLTTKTRDNKIMIALTIRNKFVDIFWFTLFHELAHVIYGDYKHRNPSKEDNDRYEARANTFAANFLIDNEKYQEFIEKNNFTKESVEHFASINGVIPSIVYGRLMKDGHMNWNKSYNRLRYDWLK